MFTRSKDRPLVSILIPSRDRPYHLIQAVDSLWSLAQDKSSLEFIFKTDEDDSSTRKVVQRIGEIPSLVVKELTTPRGNGYKDMHHWVNQMCSLASGDWLFLFNDDARMKTENWDVVLDCSALENPWFGVWDMCLFQVTTMGCESKQFPMLRRNVFELLGHFSLSPHNDTWINGVMERLRMSALTSIEVEHYIKEVKDDLKQEGQKAIIETNPSIHSLSSKRRMAEDTLKVISYLEDLWAKATWLSSPSCAGWWFWDIHGGEGTLLLAKEGENGVIKTYEIKKNGNSKEVGFLEVNVTKGKVTLIKTL